MKKTMRFSILSLAIALAIGAASAGLAIAADEAAKTGTISGKVVDKDGKAVAGATVAAMTPRAPRAEKPAGAAKLAAEGEAPKKDGPAAGGRERPKPLAETTTAEDGTFKLEKVPAGKVTVVARMKDVGVARADATVVADQDTKVDDLKLAPMERRGGAGGDGGGGAKEGAK